MFAEAKASKMALAQLGRELAIRKQPLSKELKGNLNA